MPQNLTPKQHRAIAALLTEPDVSAAARTAGVSRETLHKWLRDTDFLAGLHAAEADALAAVTRGLVRLAERATATLDVAMTDMTVPAATRVRAADAVLARLLQLRELVDLEGRVRALEAQAEGGAGHED